MKLFIVFIFTTLVFATEIKIEDQIKNEMHFLKAETERVHLFEENTEPQFKEKRKLLVESTLTVPESEVVQIENLEKEYFKDSIETKQSSSLKMRARD